MTMVSLDDSASWEAGLVCAPCPLLVHATAHVASELTGRLLLLLGEMLPAVRRKVAERGVLVPLPLLPPQSSPSMCELGPCAAAPRKCKSC